MPEVIEIKPKGIYVKIEFEIEELSLLKKAMEMCVVQANLKKKEEKEAHDYFKEKLYPFIEGITKELSHGPGPNR